MNSWPTTEGSYVVPEAACRRLGTPAILYWSWWRHQLEIFSAFLVICASNSPVTSEFPAQRPVTRSFDVFFDEPLKQQLSKQWRRRWFETSSRSLWRHCNALSTPDCCCLKTKFPGTCCSFFVHKAWLFAYICSLPCNQIVTVTYIFWWYFSDEFVPWKWNLGPNIWHWEAIYSFFSLCNNISRKQPTP